MNVIGGTRDQVHLMNPNHRFLHHHLILRQRPGLVGADVGDFTQHLQYRQLTDNTLLLGHSLHRDGHRHGNHRTE